MPKHKQTKKVGRPPASAPRIDAPVKRVVDFVLRKRKPPAP